MGWGLVPSLLQQELVFTPSPQRAAGPGSLQSGGAAAVPARAAERPSARNQVESGRLYFTAAEQGLAVAGGARGGVGASMQP